MNRRLIHLAATFAVALSSTSCLNVFSPIDQPSGDAQLTSAARGALDRGDFATALADYQKLSTSAQETAISEQAFTILDQQGVGMDKFLTFMSSSGTGGAAITTLSDSITGASQTKRSALYKAFLLSNVKGTYGARTQLQYFTQFMTGLALTAEILAEARGTSSQLLKTAITTDTTCPSQTSVSCAGACTSAGSALGTAAAADIQSAEPTGTASSDMVYWSIKYTYAALSSLSPSGGSANVNSGFNVILTNTASQPSNAGALDTCFRYQLLNFGVGR